VDSVLQFSKERHVMDRTPERLKKELEEELLLSSEDLRSHAWYHGRIPRQVPPPGPLGTHGHMPDRYQTPGPLGTRAGLKPCQTDGCTGLQSLMGAWPCSDKLNSDLSPGRPWETLQGPGAPGTDTHVRGSGSHWVVGGRLAFR
jgi:hypothetical protein